MRSEGTISPPSEPGAPVENGISLCVPHLAGREWEYIKECLDTNFVSSVGPFVDRFECALAAYVDAPYAVATVNGTAALHIALLMAGVQSDEEVLVSTLSFIAPANAIRYVGAWPVFVDAEPQYWQMDTQKLADFLDHECVWKNGALHNRTTGRRIAAVIPVHILGHPVDMDAVLSIARRYELPVIEDATESLGAQYRGTATGTMGTMGCFSFNGNKLITTGGGGMIVTRDEALATRAKYLTTQAKDDALEFVHGTVGFNYRLTNVLAALGCAQLEHVTSFVETKRRIARRYTDAFADCPGITVPCEAPWASSAYWLYTILVDAAEYGEGSRGLLHRLGEANIQTRPLWQPLHLSPAHRGASRTDCSVAEQLYARALSLPCSVGLTAMEQDRTIQLVTRHSFVS